jgi:hypothetical protein
MNKGKKRIRPLIVFMMMLAMAMFVVAPSGSQADVPNPSVDGPIPYSVGTYGFPFSTVPDLADLAALGYRAGILLLRTVLSDGGPQPQKPHDRATPGKSGAVHGTVVVEWLNVTAGADIGVDWGSHDIRLSAMVMRTLASRPNRWACAG